MEVQLAKFWGLYLVIASLTLIFSPNSRNTLLKLSKENNFGYLAGFIALILGLVQICLYAEWNSDIYTILTVFGYLAILKGIMLIGFPNYKNYILNKIDGTTYSIMLVLILGLGIVLLWHGAYFF